MGQEYKARTADAEIVPQEHRARLTIKTDTGEEFVFWLPIVNLEGMARSAVAQVEHFAEQMRNPAPIRRD